MLSQETEVTFKLSRYTDSLPIDVCVTFSAADTGKRPFIEGKIVHPVPEIYDRLNYPATTMRCYCQSDIPVHEQQEIVAGIQPGTTIKVLAEQPSTRYDGKAFGTLINPFHTFKTESKQVQLLPSALSTKQTLTVSNMPADLVERMDKKLNDIDVKRTYFLKKLINKFLVGDFDEDFV